MSWYTAFMCRCNCCRSGDPSSIIFAAKLTHRSSRPLSAVKKSASNCQTESVEQKTAVLSAVHHENLQVSEYMKKRNDKQKVRLG